MSSSPSPSLARIRFERVLISSVIVILTLEVEETGISWNMTEETELSPCFCSILNVNVPVSVPVISIFIGFPVLVYICLVLLASELNKSSECHSRQILAQSLKCRLVKCLLMLPKQYYLSEFELHLFLECSRD